MLVNKDDLLLKTSSVRFIEEITPEITTTNFLAIKGSSGTNALQAVTETNEGDKSALALHHGGKILRGWKAIADHAGCSPSTAKRHYRGMVRYSKTGSIITTADAIDEHILKTATKKKK